MIQEDYVSFETAKLLKEKGFDVPCNTFFVVGENKKDRTKERFSYSSVIADRNSYNSELPEHEYVSAPTLQTAMKWLREVHNLSVEVYRTACGYVSCIVAIPSGTDIKFLEEEGDDLPSGQYTTWDKACEAGIKYSLENLI